VLNLFASVGAATAIVEALAASIGSGLVVGGFAAGVWSVLACRSRSQIERGTMIGSYFGGSIALLAFIVDIVEKRFV
jgi:hypothetical protein